MCKDKIEIQHDDDDDDYEEDEDEEGDDDDLHQNLHYRCHGHQDHDDGTVLFRMPSGINAAAAGPV